MYDIDPQTKSPLKSIDEQRQGEAISLESLEGSGKKVYIETYGCQMNFNDSEIVASVLNGNGYTITNNFDDADVAFINTCSIRDNAEQRVRKRLKEFAAAKKHNPNAKVGILGCMAERLKKQFFEEEKIVDMVVGPDAYRNIPELIDEAEGGQKAVNVFLSKEETYAEIKPVRLQTNGVSAFVSIMRGCDNMCSFCVVPFTRGRERSRDPFTVVAEARDLFENGYREVTLLGQNVDSYKWDNPETNVRANFAQLLVMVAEISPLLRVRFSTSHPKDMTDEVLHAMANHHNICNYIHLPVQSGSSRILDLMNRTYDREWYMDRIRAIKRIIPECGISSDIITGFCTETEEDHQETLSMMEWVKYDMSYMFFYSERPGTLAERKYEDDVPEKIKKERLTEVIRLQNQHSFENNKKDIGKVFEILAEGPSKRSDADWCGRNSQNKMVVFPKPEGIEKGTYWHVKVRECTSATLLADVVDN